MFGCRSLRDLSLKQVGLYVGDFHELSLIFKVLFYAYLVPENMLLSLVKIHWKCYTIPLQKILSFIVP